FTGLPLKANGEYSKCQAIARLLVVLCNGDEEVLNWLTRWLAFPLQNVGAKMQSAVLMHSDVHGSGKSYFFDGVMSCIYGDYANIFGQTQLESQYNDWMSECLFGVFEEVLSRGQKYSHTGTIKHMVTGKTFYVNKKFMSGWKESNHMNMVFVSNEVLPLPVEPSDRRFLVVWPESKLIDELKTEVDRELMNGGAEAFYNFLLSVDLTDFTEYTEPPMTEAKRRLIEFGLPAWQVFYNEWKGGELECPYSAVRVRDLYKAFEYYCKDRNEHCMGMNKFTQFIRSKETRQKDVHYNFKSYKGKSAFFMVGCCPENKTRQEWLGGCVGEWDGFLNKGLVNQYDEAC
ncbi:primase-helicase family protein, partial [Marinagarivorans algicola]|uniref:primase-helicase family protein n=1 Tax=Marinagarivorans algicola TaxID=1513270 RepID=UPI000A66FBD7